MSLLVLLIVCHRSYGQEQPADSSTTITIDRSNTVEVFRTNEGETRYLTGQVEMSQDSIYFYAEKAIVSDTVAIAVQDVMIQQGDTTAVFSDSLHYNTSQKFAQLFGNVALQNGDQQLFAPMLDYDAATKTARYYHGGMLVSKDAELKSKKGTYNLPQGIAYFHDSVSIKQEGFALYTDSLKLNTETNVAYFLGPTMILQDTAKIYCEDGYYDMDKGIAVFRQNAQYISFGTDSIIATADMMQYDQAMDQITLTGDAVYQEGDRYASAELIEYFNNGDIVLEGNGFYKDASQRASGDRLYYSAAQGRFTSEGRSTIADSTSTLTADFIDYDQANQVAQAYGHVYWIDTVQDIQIITDSLHYNEQNESILAWGGRPLMKRAINQDTLYLRADTLRSVASSDTLATRTLLAYHDVRVYKSDLQAVCDSLVLREQDSLLVFYSDPIMWSDTSQFSADTILATIIDEGLDEIDLRQNSFIINSADEILFNQVSGRQIIATFGIEKDSIGNTEQALKKVYVMGNAQTVYFAQDETKDYVGINKVDCSQMLIYFNQNTVDRIRFYNQPTGELLPMENATDKAHTLKGFNWDITKRPKSLYDL